MAEAVEHDLRDRAAALERLETGFVINRLGQAQQRPALVEVAAARVERPGRMERAARERQGGVDQLRLVADRLHLDWPARPLVASINARPAPAGSVTVSGGGLGRARRKARDRRSEDGQSDARRQSDSTNRVSIAAKRMPMASAVMLGSAAAAAAAERC